MDTVVIARLLRPRGIKGELIAESLSSRPERVKRVFVNSRELLVERAWYHDGRLILKFEGINSMSDAEPLAGFDVCIPREERAPLGADEYYLSDLVGCQMVEQAAGHEVGTVTNWQETGPDAPVLLEVRTADGREILVPLVKAICREIDVAGRRIGVELPEGLLDL